MLSVLSISITIFGRHGSHLTGKGQTSLPAAEEAVWQPVSPESAELKKYFNQHFHSNKDFKVEVRIGILDDGSVSKEWFKAIQDRNSPAELEKIKADKKVLTAEQQAWLKLINNTFRDWSAGRAALHLPFKNIDIPKKIIILIGNQGGDDGFTYLGNRICLDLASWVQNYGDAGLKENRARLIRVMNHEYTHLLHHAWFKKHPFDLKTPFDRALRDCLVEGFGNYRSLSEKWLNENGTLTEYAKTTLQELQPVFVERLTRLQTADPSEEENLRKGLSEGSFNKKWGALCVALWLAQEANGNDTNLAKWVDRGPRGIIDLANKYLPDDLKTKFLKQPGAKP